MWNYRGAFIGVTFLHPASLYEHDESETLSLRIQPTPIRITRIILDFKHADVINPKPKTSWSTQCWNPIMSRLKESHSIIKIKAWVKVRDNHLITISDPLLISTRQNSFMLYGDVYYVVIFNIMMLKYWILKCKQMEAQWLI